MLPTTLPYGVRTFLGDAVAGVDAAARPARPHSIVATAAETVGGLCKRARMDRDELIAYCLAKPGAEETYPFGEDDVVAKVGGKMFALVNLALDRGGLMVKCGRDAEDARSWRDRFPAAVLVAPYLGRYGWNRVSLTGIVPVDDVLEMVDVSYDSVVSRLPLACAHRAARTLT